tara:strand:- start:14047 stop:14406 length:360 start_codon:yes stop_codon:yes gene_type:complete
MWIISNEDKSVASTWGAVIHLKAGEPRQVGHDLGLLCLQAGCTEVQEGEVSTPAPVEETVVEETVVEETVVEEIAVEETSVDIDSMTKIQLEEYGRTIGIELDRRKKKATLIEEIKAAQ